MFFEKNPPLPGGQNTNFVNAQPPASNIPFHQAPKKRTGGTRMFIMSFLTLLCLLTLPLFTFQDYGNVSLYATDLVRVSRAGLEITDMQRGEMVSYTEDVVDDYIEDVENPVIMHLLEALEMELLDCIDSMEYKILKVFSVLHTVFIVLLFVSVVLLLGFFLMLFASAKNMKYLYFGTNLVLFGILVILSVVAMYYTELGIGLIGFGMWATLLMMLLSALLSILDLKSQT